MTMAATCRPGARTRSDVIACTKHLRAFAIMLACDRRRADDLVRDTIEQTFTPAN
jgi:DNA-directed RNA polymerase specialized sigma24 family protein